MGHIVRTPAGGFRANWRDPAGRQRAKSFPTKRAARVYLSEMEAVKNRGAYVDPASGKAKFGPYAESWLSGRNDEQTTRARDKSIMRTHVISQWGAWSIARIGHSDVQAWTRTLSERLSPASVSECYRLLKAVLRSAIRDRLIAFNPCDGVKIQRRRRRDLDGQIVHPREVLGRIVPATPPRYRALVTLSIGTGLRWGECIGLRWDAVDLDRAVVSVVRVAVEVSGRVSAKAYPKSRAGRRVVPLSPFVVAALTEHARHFPAGEQGMIFTTKFGTPVQRGTFRARVWRPALVRAGLLGSVVRLESGTFQARWSDETGAELSKECRTYSEAVAHVVRHQSGGLRFHDLRHSYATWLVSSGVPVNDVQRVMGHEHAATTLELYTHASEGQDSRVLGALADFSLTVDGQEGSEDEEDPSGEGP